MNPTRGEEQLTRALVLELFLAMAVDDAEESLPVRLERPGNRLAGTGKRRVLRKEGHDEAL